MLHLLRQEVMGFSISFRSAVSFLRLFHLLFRLLIIGGMFLLHACEPTFEDLYEVFVIESGKHRSNKVGIQMLQSETLRFEAIFDSTAIYETFIEENQHDINKLLGFSECNDQHHDNSARFGWRWLNDVLEIHTYVYNNNERTSIFMGTIALEQAYTYEIEMRDENYVFMVDGLETVIVPRTHSCNRGLYYMLFPYFGGDETAPHDLLIRVKFLH